MAVMIHDGLYSRRTRRRCWVSFIVWGHGMHGLGGWLDFTYDVLANNKMESPGLMPFSNK
jgi:hypothetical protein